MNNCLKATVYHFYFAYYIRIYPRGQLGPQTKIVFSSRYKLRVWGKYFLGEEYYPNQFNLTLKEEYKHISSMGKYHKQENPNTYTVIGKSVVPIIQYKYKTARQSPSMDRTTRSPCHLWTSPTSHVALKDEVHISSTVIFTNGGCAL